MGLFWLPEQLRDLGWRFSDYQQKGTGQAAAAKGDASQDIFSGGSGADRFYVNSKPASKDILSCGSGRDFVRADEADVVAGDCERVKRV